MNWADTVRSVALAALAEREATTARLCVTMPSSWNPHEVWLSRVTPPRNPADVEGRRPIGAAPSVP